MNSRFLGRLGLALIGVYALIVAISGLTTLVAVASVSPQLSSLAIAATPMALIAALSYVLVFQNDRVAAAILPDGDTAGEVGLSDLPRILVVLLGALVLIQSIPETLIALVGYVAAAQFGAAPRNGVAGRLLGYAIQVGIALFLIMRPQRLLDVARRRQPE